LANLIENQIDEVFIEKEDGFIIDLQPYGYFEVSDYGMTGTDRYSLDGENYNTLSWEVTDGGFKWSEQGTFANLPDFFDEFGQDTYTRDLKIVVDEDEPSLNIFHEITMDGDEGHQESIDNLTITGSVGGKDGITTANLSFDYTKAISGFDEYIEEQWPEWSEYSEGYKMNAESEFSIDLEACGEYLDSDLSGNCFLKVATKRSFNGQAKKESRLKLTADDNRVTIIANPEVGASKPYFLALKSENNKGVSEALNAYNFWAVTFREGREAPVLLIRVPLCNGLDNYVFPLVEEWSRTYIAAAEKLSDEGWIYAIWYIDQIVANIPEGEFDCSPLVEASRLDSGLFELNAELQQFCEQVDVAVQLFVQDQPYAEDINDFRSFVRTLNSDQAKSEVNAIARNVFAI
jgi:hypothetical protein